MYRFESTHIYEQVFSAMKVINKESEVQLKNGYLQYLLTVATTMLTPDINSLVAKIARYYVFSSTAGCSV
jgi:hypothetical protein